MSKGAFVESLEGYAREWHAPIETNIEVMSCKRTSEGFALHTGGGDWTARAVVVAAGHCDRPVIPLSAEALRGPLSIHASQYRSPGELPGGGVLAVGASSSGVQIADELACAGRRVVLSVGKHTRLPRTWRGHDIFFWLCEMGLMAATRGRPREPGKRPAPAFVATRRPTRQGRCRSRHVAGARRGTGRSGARRR
ncbi:NAD(P)-binding domain-containing protein [Mesorhizobium atlanticum]